MAINLARGGGRADQSAVLGLKELEAKLRALMPVDGSPMAKEVQSVVAGAADEVRDAMRSSARAAGWPQNVIDSVFSYGRTTAITFRGPEGKATALAGVNKRRTMVEWIAGKHPKSPNAKVTPGNKVAMSRAAMLEFGTTRSPAKPAIRSALKAAGPMVVARLAAGFNAILTKFSK